MRPPSLMPAPVGRKNGHTDLPPDPREEKPARGSSSGPARIPQKRDSKLTAESITEVLAPDNSGQKKSVWPPFPPVLIDAVAEGALGKLPALPEETTPAEAIPCKIELRLGLNAEPKGAPSSGHFDSDSTERFCRLVRIWLNICHPAMRACLEKAISTASNFSPVRHWLSVCLSSPGAR
jgi:hypothetical protein